MTLVLAALAPAGCAKYNTYFNAKKAFDSAERVREDAVRRNQDPPKPNGTQKTDYETAIAKAQKLLDEYPGHSLSDDALFLRAKAYYRLESYRMSIRQFDLLFQNFPATEYLEESLYLQALNHLLIGALDRSQDYLGQLARAFPDSRFQSEVDRVSGDNSFALEDWEAARGAYSRYLALGDRAGERDRVALKLAECLWELERYAEADTVLGDMLERVPPGELAFRGELLRGRALVRAGDPEAADDLLGGLDQAAAFHKAEGELALARGELLAARGKVDDAATLLESMPVEWLTPVVKARVADLLGYRLLTRQDYAEAHEQFKIALGQKDKLEDPDRTRSLNDQLKEYLAAETDLAAAKADRVPRLKLLQANAMLFGFDRPARAADLYGEAAADSAADSLVAARALYGLWLAHSRRLDNPDSAQAIADELTARFPGSAQAREVGAPDGGTLLDFLLVERAEVQELNYAALSDDERSKLEEETTTSADAGEAGRPFGRSAARRRMIYMARRDPLVFPPPEVVIPIGGQHPESEAARAAARSGSPGVEPGPDQGVAPPGPGAEGGAAAEGTAPDGSGSGTDPEPRVQPAPSGPAPGTGEPQGSPEPAKPEEKEEPKKPARERDPNWDRLRSPGTGSRP
ncbi:MAG: tetratricopeptide repeat protein [bacterium]|nr:tetratricopeptide repeat protein [bacterium]